MICPKCGNEVRPDGTVFIESGPYMGHEYFNEGDYTRYRCTSCDYLFAEAPDDVKCSECGEVCYGEEGDECRYDPEHSTWLCESCMKLYPDPYNEPDPDFG